jgi:hypothetical protein
MALRLKPETREAWKKYLDEHGLYATATIEQWRPVPRAEPATEKVYDTHTYDIYAQTWVDT